MRRWKAAAGSAVFFVAAPVVVAGLIPWWLTHWQVRLEWPTPVRIAGLVLVVVGAVVLVQAFVRFVVEGLGTPAPIAPTQRLVVGGLYRHVRNPMYLAVLAVIVGQAIWFGDPVLLGYAAVIWVAVAAFVLGYEEPSLSERFGEEYDAYRKGVRAWVPRVHPWTPNGGHQSGR
jgi:protein-S-isoprenylcysteine O-methyltransferase Ste14